MTTLREAAQQALEALEFSTLDAFMLAPISPGRESTIKAITALRAALAEPVQEPIGWFGYDKSIGTWFETNEGDDDSVPLYATPPQRKPLTDEEIQDCWQQRHRDKATERRLITRAIERAHGIGGKHESA